MTTSTLSSTNQLPDGPPSRASTGGLVGWSLHHRTIAIGGWVLLVLLCVLGGNLTGTVKATSVQLTPGEAGRAAAMVTAAGLEGRDVESVLITAGSGGRLPEASLGADSPAVADLTATLRAVPGVSDVGTAVIAADRSAVLLPVTLADDVKDPNALLAGVSTAAAQHPELHLEVSGPLTQGADVDNQLAGDFSAALVRSLPITVVILLLAFGAFAGRRRSGTAGGQLGAVGGGPVRGSFARAARRRNRSGDDPVDRHGRWSGLFAVLSQTRPRGTPEWAVRA